MQLSLLFFLASVFCFQYAAAQPGSVTSILNKILDKYDKRVRPSYGEKAAEVNVTMYLIRGIEWSEKDMLWKAQFYFRQSWQDQRLAFNFPGISNITVGPETSKYFWQPDTFFTSSTTSKLQSGDHVFFRINSDGSILNSVLVTTETFCQMDLSLYPHDNQRCTLQIESYGYGNTDIVYHWQDVDKPVSFDPTLHFDDKKMVKTEIRNLDLSLSSGKYSILLLDVDVTRNAGYFCRQFYMPALIFAILTWLTFWVPESAKVFRGIGVLVSFLAYFVLSYRVVKCLPRLDYPTRLEQYASACLVMSLIVVMEYVLVLWVSRRHEGKIKMTEEKPQKLNKDPESDQKINNASSYVGRSVKYILTLGQHRRAPAKIDLVSRIAYPVVFVMFNVWYWNSF